MKQVILKSLTLCNFKGEKLRTTEFNADVTTISGGNGLGKSRHFDAFVWLLFGKDTQERKDYEIKTRVDGEELHKCECSVTGVLLVDGEELTIKRAFMEDWGKKRGETEERFKGNNTECWWNDTPVNVSEYTKRVQNIIDAQVFKMITNPAFFANMKWNLQREQLFMLAGTISDAEIASMDDDCKTLIDHLSGKSLADYKKELAFKKKKLNEELAQIQPRVDQTEKMKPESFDWHVLEQEIASCQKTIAELDEQITSVAARERAIFEEEQSKQRRINDLKRKQNAVVEREKVANIEYANKANRNRIQVADDLNRFESLAKAAKERIKDYELEIARKNHEISKIDDELKTLMAEFGKEQAKEYQGETICPHCGQALPDDMIANAKDIFNTAKVAKLNDINQRGKAIQATKKMMVVMVDEIRAELEASRHQSTEMEANAQALQNQLNTMPAEVQAQEVIASELTEWQELQKQIEAIQGEQATTESATFDVEEVKKNKAELEQHAQGLVLKLAKRDDIAKADAEIESLNKRGDELAKAINDIEKQEFTIQTFTKRKIEECEKRINGCFKLVTFRLFDTTQDGNLVETCVPLVDGVPYGSANTASKVNAGLDIINALCAFYEVSAPIFIDNAESVNEFVNTNSQMVFLKVTNDKELIIK